MSLKTGDVVTLNSGNIRMTVERVVWVAPLKPRVVHCVWFYGGDLKRDIFFEDVLNLTSTSRCG